jgi:hypothetical protein
MRKLGAILLVAAVVGCLKDAGPLVAHSAVEAVKAAAAVKAAEASEKAKWKMWPEVMLREVFRRENMLGATTFRATSSTRCRAGETAVRVARARGMEGPDNSTERIVCCAGSGSGARCRESAKVGVYKVHRTR